mmetsp:Transcript_3495/g.6135  ORF Transcript_3495/g.6135 Transcript_3495/m.6135 type:complete len:200 (+) Transcript_3495:1303-1902(+)
MSSGAAFNSPPRIPSASALVSSTSSPASCKCSRAARGVAGRMSSSMSSGMTCELSAKVREAADLREVVRDHGVEGRMSSSRSSGIILVAMSASSTCAGSACALPVEGATLCRRPCWMTGGGCASGGEAEGVKRELWEDACSRRPVDRDPEPSSCSSTLHTPLPMSSAMAALATSRGRRGRRARPLAFSVDMVPRRWCSV